MLALLVGVVASSWCGGERAHVSGRGARRWQYEIDPAELTRFLPLRPAVNGAKRDGWRQGLMTHMPAA